MFLKYEKYLKSRANQTSLLMFSLSLKSNIIKWNKEENKTKLIN